MDLRTEILDQILTELRGLRQQTAPVREILDIEETADYLRLSVNTVREKVRLRQIPFFRVGGTIRFRRSKLDRWVDRSEVMVVE